MDLYVFPDGEQVRLRSRVHGTYLHADEDGRGVSLSGLRSYMDAAWEVHHYHHEGNNHVVLQSSYGRYLAGTDDSAPLGCPGFRVDQRNYHELDDVSFRWLALRTGPADHILLLHVVDDRYLRANRRHLPRSENVVSIEDYGNVSAMMEWVVETIPRRQPMPRLPSPTRLHLPGSSRVVMGNGDGTDVAPEPDYLSRTAHGWGHRLPGTTSDPPAPTSDPPVLQGDWKTELCNHWLEHRICPFGHECSFAHGQAELRQVDRPDWYMDRLCRYGSACRYAARGRCHFRH